MMKEEFEGFRLSPQQGRLWTLWKESPATYRAQCAIWLPEAGPNGDLREAVERVVSRHEVLRTSFRKRRGLKLPLQVVSEPGEGDGVHWRELDLGLPADREKTLHALLAEESAAELDLEAGAQVRATLGTLGSGERLLVLTVPALCADGQTLEQISREIVGSEPEDEEPLRYVQVSEWLHGLLEDDEDAEEGKAYWSWLKKDVPLVPELPRERSAVASGPFLPERVEVPIDGETSAALDRLAEVHDTAAEEVLFIAWQMFLGRLTGRDELAVERVLDGREDEELAEVPGPLARAIPIHCSIDPVLSLDALVERTADALQAALDWEIYFRREDEKEPDPTQNPVAFEALEWTGPELFAQSVSIERFKLQLSCLRQGGRWSAALRYDPRVFHRRDVEAMAQGFEALLADAVRRPGVPLAELRALGAEEERMVLEDLNRTAVEERSDTSVLSLFRRQVEQAGERPAIWFEGEAISYGELDARAGQLAGVMRARGVGPESRVALFLDRSPEALVAILAVLEAGGAYLCMDLDDPVERLTWMLEDAAPALVLTRGELQDRLPETTRPVLLLEEAAAETGAERVPEPAVDGDSLAYVLYTSGSTGRPKGVMVPHRGLLNYLNWALAEYVPAVDRGAAVHSSLGFDLTVTSIFCPLLSGGSVILLPEDRRVEELPEIRPEGGFSLLKLTPSHLELLRHALPEEALADLADVLILGGEALHWENLASWRRQAPQTRLINEYGPTETVVGCCTYEVPAEAAQEGHETAGPVPIGRPIANTRLYLLDRSLRPVPFGVIGELYVAGSGVVRGYLDRPTLSAERFLPNPFGERAGDRLYQTGDLARYRRVDGEVQLVYLGRNDDQIKVRGFRVEPGEIEGALRRHPAVEDAVVALHSSASGPLLTAYLIASDTLIAQDLRDHLGDFLPAAMIPTHFVPLDSFPLTPNGKVDRRALPEPTASRSLGGFEQEKPRGPVEARMLEIWEEELQQESFGVTDRFFDLGGDSIRAVRLIARLNEEFSANLTVPDVFQHQSVRELCAQLEQTSDRQSIAEIWSLGNEQIEQIKASILEDAEARAKLPPDFEDIYPMAGGEKGMAYYTLLMPDQPIYHDQYGYPLSIEDVARFVRCFELVVGRHTVLRTAYDLYRFSEPMKIVRRSPELPLHIEDLSRLDPAAQRARIQDYQTQDLYKHFTFDNEILWRLRVFVLKEGRAYVIWSWHHAIIDGWSDMTLWTELNNLYGREDFDSIDVLPEPKSSYRDYLAITLGQKVSPEIEEFWRQRVVGAERNRLPFGRPLVPTKTYGMKHLDVFLGEELLERLQKRSRELHVPLPTICLAAHLYLLWVISGEDEILTGLVTHDRPPIADSDRIVGCFLDTFPVQVDMRTIESRQALISLVSETLIAFRSNHLPLVDIGALAGSRAASGNPLFDTLFTFMDFHRLAEMAQDSLFRSKLAGEEPEEDDYYEERTQEMTNTKFDVEVITTLGYFLVRIKYDPDSFDKRDISTAGHLYRRVLEELISDVDQPLAPETLLTDAQRRVLVKDYNDTTVEYPQDLRLQDLLPARAESDRASQALVSGGRELSYGELGGRVQALAEQLLADGLRPGESVAVIFERSVELVVGILGVLEAGGAYVPIEPDIPAVRKGYIVANSGVSLVVADREYELEFPETAKAPEAVRFVLWGSDSAQASADATRPGPGPEVPGARPVDLAYTIYTSGSTGVPKGVMIEHHAAINLISWVNRTYGVDATHRILMLASVSFDLSVYDLFGSLLAGATLVVATREEQREPEKLKRLLTEERVTFWNSVPSSMAMLVRYLEEIEPSYRQEDLRVVFLSGDWIPVALPAKIRQFFPRCEVVSLGGATEATVWSIYHPIVEDVSRFNSVPYGRPLDNNSFHILSSRAELVPEGVIGELFIGGVGVARGYANDAVKTARAFVPDPFSPDPGARLYRTGDQGRRLPDGEIEFLGRRDHQVKIRGFRVELGEIESQLARHEQIEDLAVLARRDASGESYLCAYFVPRESSLSSGELEAFLAKTLPDYMIPTAFIPLEELPRNANGKLDRAALPEPGAYWTAEDRQMAAPENDAQKSLVEIWREVLGQEKIGIDHDFFELGGHSLSAMQVVTRIRTVFGVELPLRVFFESPTVRFLAERLAEQEATGGKGAALEWMRAAPRLESPPLSFAQERFWFLQRVNPESTAMNIGSAVRLLGEIDFGALAATTTEIFRRHEILRSRYSTRDGKPAVHILPPEPHSPSVIDLRALSSEAREAALEGLVREEIRRPLDLENDLLLRLLVIRWSDGEAVVRFVLHHSIGDGWSMGILTRELGLLYDAFRKGEGSPLPELEIQFPAYAQWQRHFLESEEMERQLDYWRRQLAPPRAVLELPMQRRRGDTSRFLGASIAVSISDETSAAVRSFAQREGGTAFMVLLAAWSAVLHDISGQEDVLIGTNVANRDGAELERVIGPFVNNVVLRHDLSGDPTFTEFFAQVRDTAFEAYAHQDVPFELLVEKLRPEREGSFAPLFQVMFVWQNFPHEIEGEAPMEALRSEFRDGTGVANYDLFLMMSEDAGGLVGALTYDVDLFEGAVIERLARSFEQLLEQCLVNPDHRLSLSTAAPVDETQPFLDDFNEPLE